MRGFSLIEVLVAIVVLSFGMLGVVGLQAYAVQANRDARMQAQAANLARELAEMMRGNKAVGAKPGVPGSTPDNPYIVDLSGTMSSGPSEYCMIVSNASTGCTTAKAVAAAEMTEWLTRLRAELPGARVVVCFDSAPYDSSGKGQWDCTPSSSGIAVIKIGWTRNSTDRSATGTAVIQTATQQDSVPSLIFPVTSGNSQGDT
ncbi:type IV pilus modification protein PilV [Paracidovorax anthurii]|uniref:Type IV pilus assembly protein PilV n=1 Tax=Paracidovorax anthurii TaxID=78229 RepID=A0A328YHI0_9BURK|nr:type IV pilus modification protein PilV [Paracidovorax anthurii]RAR71442.1 type IV pilus assembly protein PilV [Paracidovorax anthurii]